MINTLIIIMSEMEVINVKKISEKVIDLEASLLINRVKN